MNKSLEPWSQNDIELHVKEVDERRFGFDELETIPKRRGRVGGGRLVGYKKVSFDLDNHRNEIFRQMKKQIILISKIWLVEWSKPMMIL